MQKSNGYSSKVRMTPSVLNEKKYSSKHRLNAQTLIQ